MSLLYAIRYLAMLFATIAGGHGVLRAQSNSTKQISTVASVNSKLPPITAVAIDEKNGWVIAGSQAGLVIRAWPTLEQIRVLPTQLEQIHDVALSPDGNTLVAAGGSPAATGEVELYDWPSGELRERIRPHADLVYSVAWRADSSKFASASADKTVKVFAGQNAKCLAVLQGHSRPILAAEFLPGEFGIISAGVDESLRLWSTSIEPSGLSSVNPLRTLTNHTGHVVDLALRPAPVDTLPIIASVGSDSTVRFWQPTIGRMMRFAKLPSIPLAICWIGDGNLLAVACADGMVRFVDPESVQIVGEKDAVQGAAYCIAADSQGRLIVGGDHGELRALSLDR